MQIMKMMKLSLLLLFTSTFWLLSCRSITDADMMGCYQDPKQGVGSIDPYAYDFLVLHNDKTYSQFFDCKNCCDGYMTRKYPITGTWKRKGASIYLSAYANSDSKEWVIETKDTSLNNITNNEMKVFVHRNWDAQIDTLISYIAIDQTDKYDSIYNVYDLKHGECIIKKKTDAIELFINRPFDIRSLDFYDFEYSLRDSLSNRLDMYVVPKANHGTSFKLKYVQEALICNSDKLSLKWLIFPYHKKIFSYKKVK